MEPSRRPWSQVFALLGLPLVIVLAVMLGVLAALAFYVRGLVVALLHPFQRREPTPVEAFAGPRVSPASAMSEAAPRA
jgi:hypothetical protein